MAVVIEHSGPPPFASGEDWAAYFREYRAGRNAILAERAEKARLIAENGKFRLTDHEFVLPVDMEGGAATLINALLAMNRKLGPESQWKWLCERTETHHDATVYVNDAESKNENDEKPYLAGDERYPPHDELHQFVSAGIHHGRVLMLFVAADWTQKVQEGESDSISFKFAKTYVAGIGWDYFQSVFDFNDWQYTVGIKKRPKPKKKPEAEDPLMAPLENGEWNG